MKYTININQPKALELGITNLNQAIIFDMLTTASVWATPITIDGDVYFWVSRGAIVNELPLLGLKKDTVYRHLKSLAKMELIDYNKIGKKDCIKITQKGKKYLMKEVENSEMNPKNSQNSEMNPKELGNESENNSEMNPTDKNTNTYQDTKDKNILFDAYMRVWNETAEKYGLSKIISMTKARKKKVEARLGNIEDFKEMLDTKAMNEIANSQYLQGKTARSNWKITFDWLIANDTNIIKVIEGNYRDPERGEHPTQTTGNQSNIVDQNQQTLERMLAKGVPNVA